jgi:glycosyltransferase involved in cell wall biosynthesis
VAERVRFAGAIGQEEIGKHYARADVFVLPSFAEGLPVVLVEAMATGLPVVASRITGIPELVSEGESGLLSVPGDLDGLVDALGELVTAPPERRLAMGRAGHERVVAAFDLTQTADELLAVFRRYLVETN